MTTEEWILLILLGIAVVAIIIGATSAATNHSQKKQQQKSGLRQNLNNITGGCRWMVDQGAMSVLQATSAGQAQGSWNSTRPQMVNLEQQIAQLSAGTGDSGLDDSLSALGRSVAGLRGSLDSYVSTMAGGHQDLVDGARQTVMQRRQQVETALQPVIAAQP